jgi:type IV pilus assembly protein PilV
MRNNKGVSLVEVMIALVVLLLVFLALLQTALLSIDNNLRNLLRQEAISIADQQMIDLKNTPFENAALTAGLTCPVQTIQRDFRQIKRDYNVCVEVTDLDDTPDTKRVTVVVGWNHRNETTPLPPTGNEYQHSITTVRRR